MNKGQLRAQIKTKLSDLSNAELHSRSQLLSRNLAEIVSEISRLNGFIRLGVYSPIQKEPLWFLGFQAGDYEYSLVHMVGEKSLSYHPIEFESLVSAKYGLELSEEVLAQTSEPQIVLVPGIAFTKEGERLGRGKGYFDNFLQNFSGIKIGICFEDQIVENVLNEKHDVAMDILVTDIDIYKGKMK